KITRDLFLFGSTSRYLLFEKKNCGIVRLPVEWEVEDIIRSGENAGGKAESTPKLPPRSGKT
ncbi:MAG: hypothetical protein GY941_03260, partial [Planctomycetes bacterium]|nr:hypothetical protein [Planctomycetota bacterium]